GLPVPIQPSLVALDDGLGHLAGPHNASLLAPDGEGAQVVGPILHGPLGVALRPKPFEEGGQAHRHALRVARVAERCPRLLLAPLRHQPPRGAAAIAAYDAFDGPSPDVIAELGARPLARLACVAAPLAIISLPRPPPDTGPTGGRPDPGCVPADP